MPFLWVKWVSFSLLRENSLWNPKESWYQMTTVHLHCELKRSYQYLLNDSVCFKCHNPFWPLGLKHAVYFLYTETYYIIMMNLLNIETISCVEHRSGIKQNLLFGICILLQWLYFMWLTLLEMAYIYTRIFKSKLMCDWFRDNFGNGGLLMILQI